MGIPGIVVVFFVSWFLVLLILLPFGVRNDAEAGVETPEGHMAGAPVNAHMKLKAIGATLGAAAITAVVYVLVTRQILTLEAMDGVLELWPR